MKKSIIITLIFIYVFIFLGSTAQAVAKVSPEIWSEYLHWNKMVKKYPQGPISHFNLAMTMAYMGKTEEASALLNKTYELDNKIIPRLLKIYNKKLKKEPNNWRWHFRLGFLYYFIDKYNKAIEHFERVTEHDPVSAKNAWAYGYIAVIKGKQNKWHRAIEACQKGLDIEPDGAALHAALAKAYYEQKKYVEASAAIIKALHHKKEFKEYEKEMWEESR